MFSLLPFLEKYNISPNDILIVGVSGWVDSMVLLENLIQVHSKEKLIVVHVNHGLRGEESDRDTLFVQEYCKNRNICVETQYPEIKTLSEKAKKSIETFAREERRRIFEEVREKHWAKYIFLAHHLDDSIETLFLNFIRGTKLRWLSGIPEQNEYILRPFLAISKNTIREFAKENQIPFREDSSNSDDSYLRNRVRNNIVPEAEKINPNFRENLWDFAKYAWEVEAYFTHLLSPILEKKNISEDDFRAFPSFLQKTLIERVYSSIHSTSVGLSEGNISEIVRFMLTANGGTKKELGKLSFTKKWRSIFW